MWYSSACQPQPSPSTKLPRLMSSMDSAILAIEPGLWNAVHATMVPMGMPGSAAAMPAVVVQHSQTPRLTAVSLQLEHEVIRQLEHVEPDLDGESGHGHRVPEAIDRRV